MTAAKVKTPEQASAFMAMVAQGTKQLSSEDSFQFVVDAAQKWKAEALNPVAQKGDLTKLAKALDLELTPAQLGAGKRTPQSNEEKAFAYFIDKGLTRAQAAGIVGNLIQESGVNPASEQLGGGPGRGIAQWSIGERWNRVLELAQKQGKSPKDLDVQLDFIWQELNTTESVAFDALKQAGSAAEAAVAFEEKYERAGIPNNEARIANAQEVLSKFGDYEYGGEQIGSAYYQRALDVFGARDEKKTSPSPSTSTSTSTSTGGAAAPVSSTDTQPSEAPVSGLAPSPALADQTRDLGHDIDPFTLWFIEQLMSLYGADGLAKALEDNPDFQKFVKAQKGMKDWKPGDKVPKAVVAAFMAKKMKAAGIDPKQPGAAARLISALNGPLTPALSPTRGEGGASASA